MNLREIKHDAAIYRITFSNGLDCIAVYKDDRFFAPKKRLRIPHLNEIISVELITDDPDIVKKMRSQKDWIII